MLDVEKWASSVVVFSGAPLTYTLVVTNVSEITRTVIVTDQLPWHIEPGKTSGGTALVSGGVLTWTPTITAPGGVWRETLVVTVAPDYNGPLTNVLHASSLEGWDDISVTTIDVLVKPLIDVHKRASSAEVHPGSQLTYTLSVTNVEGVTRTVLVTDRLPLYIESGETSGGTALVPGGVLTWTPTITAPGGVWRETVVLTVAAGYTGPLTNEIYVATEEEGLIARHAVRIQVVMPWRVFLPIVLRLQP